MNVKTRRQSTDGLIIGCIVFVFVFVFMFNLIVTPVDNDTWLSQTFADIGLVWSIIDNNQIYAIRLCFSMAWDLKHLGESCFAFCDISGKNPEVIDLDSLSYIH